MSASAQERFTAALEKLVGQIRCDRSIVAAILCGSLSHDTVWDKSDIDLALITTDDKSLSPGGVALYADGVNVHAFLMTRAEFRKTVEGAIRSSFQHSLLAKGRLIYTHDETISRLCEQLQSIGERDTVIQLLSAASSALAYIYKARKWFLMRRDLDYTALWILYAATPLARIEVLNARLLVDREVIPQAMRLNPGFFKVIYSDLLNTKKMAKNVEAALSAMDVYLADRTQQLFSPVIDHLRDAGEARSVTEIDDHFKRNFGVTSVMGICEYLADQQIISKVSLPVRLTKRSNIQVEELAFFSSH